MPQASITEVEGPDERGRVCEEILRELPDWFGIESAIAEYVDAVRELPTWVAGTAERPLGFLSVKVHAPQSAEIYVMGVRSEAHRRGIGTSLVRAAEELLRSQAVEYLQVKTLGPSRPSEQYARTRAFYESLGFVPLEELHGLWEGNPALIMIKRLE